MDGENQVDPELYWLGSNACYRRLPFKYGWERNKKNAERSVAKIEVDDDDVSNIESDAKQIFSRLFRTSR